MPTQVLCVAEKPSIAKAVAQHLSGNDYQTRNITGNNYVKNYEFHYNFPTWGACNVTMTSVTGHLTASDFDSQYRNWQSCDPADLFDARINTYVDDERKPIAKNIETRARHARYLFIWTDCDREGEHIGSEIRDTAVHTNPQLKQPGRTFRARFSNTERTHIIHAANNPVVLDEAQAAAVASRIELDLRLGASFTRNLSLKLQNIISPGERRVISYGSCQFPTLGFVVDRYFRVRNFVPETFWGIKVMHEKQGINVNFRWTRNHLFDRMMVVILFERCLAARTARVTKVQTKATSKWKPLPLTTVELQKCGSRFLRMDSQRVMTVAEQLYQKGFLSYPRTETDQFERNMDIRSLVGKQTSSEAWGQFAEGLRDGGFSWPRNGRNNDKAHPPIHPVQYVAPGVLSAEERKVYEFVTRRFLACCSQDARGSKTEISILYGSETFNASGLTVLERNYLDVYPYDKWTSSQDLPQFTEGETFVPTEARIHEGKTSPPGYLTEPELISLMDANGIGTDATMAQHIVQIKLREYVETRPRTRQPCNDGEEVSEEEDNAEDQPAGRGGNRGRGRGGRGRGRGGRGGGNARGSGAMTGVQEFIPTTLGVALIQGYEDMGFEMSLAKPFLRKEMEQKMRAICDGRKTKAAVVQETIEQYRAVYQSSQVHFEMLRRAVQRYVLGQAV